MLAARIPAQQCNKVKDCFWQVALLAIILDKLQGIGIALGQFLACFRVDNQGHVPKFWSFPAQSFINHELLRRVGDMVISTNNV